jgi:hypothetical protein
VLVAVSVAGWRVATRGAKAGAAAAAAAKTAAPRSTGTDTMRLVPDGVRVKIEVLNASSERGLARRAMFYLRARGFDVVSMGNADQQTDSSVVIDRSGHPDWAAAAARALGKARVETKLDSSRYLDLTVLLGAAFRAPPQIISP